MALTQANLTNPSGLPDIIRVKCAKGFRGPADGVFQNVNPGDVVDVPRELAFELRAANKAYMTTDDKKRVPAADLNAAKVERRRVAAMNDPTSSNIASLAARIEALQQQLTALQSQRATKSQSA